jgi:crossover junction endodeoxyribonuclease RuvC
MRILGIDPGSRSTGFGLVDVQGARLAYVASGVIRTSGEELALRIGEIIAGIAEVAATWKPDVAAIEQVFVNVNPQSTLMLGQARGAAIAALVTAQLPVSEYTALQTKKSVVGHGKASKEQVQEMVKRLLQLPGLPGSDAADALACAICHANASVMTASLNQLASAANTVLGERGRRGRVTQRRGRVV